MKLARVEIEFSLTMNVQRKNKKIQRNLSFKAQFMESTYQRTVNSSITFKTGKSESNWLAFHPLRLRIMFFVDRSFSNVGYLKNETCLVSSAHFQAAE